MVDEKKEATTKSLSQEIINLKKEHSNEINILKEKIKNLENMVDKVLKNQKPFDKEAQPESDDHDIDKKDKVILVKCVPCNKTFARKKDLKEHRKIHHPCKIKCDECDLTFAFGVALEKHMESHQKSKNFKCDICNKEFYLKWRLQKHLNGHEKKRKFCHYYNNKLFCPFEENGCMFNHAISPTCKFNDKCTNTLCKFRHEKNDSTAHYIEEQDTFKHISTSTPLKDDTKVNPCKICIKNIYTGQKIFKCEECEHNICENCALKTHIADDPDYFMCMVCL